ncbi:unnamed protein product [Clonostachys byssicola]|uniref:NAD-dependent epimerase/dehydratase domain-containing protein n=1 Tax=Clonostachys byssicola TaxID=160290 RepID=A0A9N9XZP4_9HYPO|nr:unnamed protein product [Clonostachys byssicola]
MAKPLVLLTGGTGFVGHAVLVDLLKSGYRVRLAARSASKINQTLAIPSIAAAVAEDKEVVSSVVVPDMSSPGAYDVAVKDVTYIIHVASPLPSFEEGKVLSAAEEEQRNSHFVAQSRQAAVNILQSANKAGNDSIRRIVMTSSTVAIVPFDVFLNKAEVLEPTYDSDSRVPVPSPPYSNENQAYCAGKVAALNDAEEFMRVQRPKFDLISINPSWIFGFDERAVRFEQLRDGVSNTMLADYLMGAKREYGLAGTGVLCSDVARAHVKALDPAVKGNQSFIVSSPMQWEDAISVAKERYPQAFVSGLFRADGEQLTIPLKLDTTKTQNILGINLANFEKMVDEVAGQYVKLSQAKGQ